MKTGRESDVPSNRVTSGSHGIFGKFVVITDVKCANYQQTHFDFLAPAKGLREVGMGTFARRRILRKVWQPSLLPKEVISFRWGGSELKGLPSTLQTLQ